MPYIIHHYNGDPISHFILEDKLSIGRREDNDIQIDDVTLSAEHALFERCEAGFQVKDLDSTNGLLYKGEKIYSRLLVNGDYVMMGTHDLEFVEQLPDTLEKTAKIRKSWIPGVYFTRA